MDIAGQLRTYILENYLFTDDEALLPDQHSLFDNGIIDSTGVLDLVAFIEETFGVSVPDADLVPENFDTVERIAAFVAARTQQP